MTGRPDDAMTCAQVEELAAELALGSVSGTERAAALAHLARCTSCRTLVDQLARAADNLLLLAPTVEPPPGFESRVLARITAAAQPVPFEPRRARRRVWAGVAAAAAVTVAAAFGGAGVADMRRGETYPPVASAQAPAGVRTALVADQAGRWTCRVVVYGDTPTWLVVSLDRTDGLNAAYSVEAVRTGSNEGIPVGTLTIDDGHGSLATTVDVGAPQFTSVRVVDAGGHVRYEAVFPQPA